MASRAMASAAVPRPDETYDAVLLPEPGEGRRHWLIGPARGEQ
ncbi:protein of unknown function [Burkholderia multivorans]